MRVHMDMHTHVCTHKHVGGLWMLQVVVRSPGARVTCDHEPSDMGSENKHGSFLGAESSINH